MNLVLAFLEFVREQSQPLAAELQQLVTRINAWARVNHRSDGTHLFPWATEPYDANAFSASGSMTWTVEKADVLTNRSMVIDRALCWTLGLVTTAVAGTASTDLRVRLPRNLRGGPISQRGVFVGLDNGTAITGQWLLEAGSPVLRLFRDSLATNWAATGTTNIWVSITVEIE